MQPSYSLCLCHLSRSSWTSTLGSMCTREVTTDQMSSLTEITWDPSRSESNTRRITTTKALLPFIPTSDVACFSRQWAKTLWPSCLMWISLVCCFSHALMGMCWTTFDHSPQVHEGGTRPQTNEETHTSYLWILIYTYLSRRPWPLILIGTQKVDEHTNTLLYHSKCARANLNK